MARGKKAAKELTAEEKLGQALVPVDEQPYPVPENWCWVYGTSIFLPMETEKPKGEVFRYIDIDSIDNMRQVILEPKELLVSQAPSRARRKLHIGDTVFSMVRPYLKNIAYIDETISDSIASTGFYVCTPRKNINTRYIYYLMISPYVVDGVNAFMKGDNSPSIRKDDLEKYSYPMPPLAEQQRIVDRIESIFAKLDEAKEKVQAVVDGFELRKSAILHKAFTGELTEKWRQEHNPPCATVYLADIQNSDKCVSRKDFKFWINPILPQGWAESKIGNLLYFAGRIGWKGLKAEEYTEKGPFLLSVYNLNDGDEVTYHRVYHITQERYDESPEIMVQEGDILLTKDGAGIGKLGYVKKLPQQATINSSLLLIRPANVAISKYIYYTLLGPNMQHTVKERITGSTTPHLFQRDIKEFVIPIPSLEEQNQIVFLLDTMLFKEQQAKESAEAVIAQIDTMKKAVLARAFRGELGTNDPTEESAVELLKEVL